MDSHDFTQIRTPSIVYTLGEDKNYFNDALSEKCIEAKAPFILHKIFYANAPGATKINAVELDLFNPEIAKELSNNQVLIVVVPDSKSELVEFAMQDKPAQIFSIFEAEARDPDKLLKALHSFMKIRERLLMESEVQAANKGKTPPQSSRAPSKGSVHGFFSHLFGRSHPQTEEQLDKPIELEDMKRRGPNPDNNN